MSFAQLTYRDNLQDIESCLRTIRKKTVSCRHKKPVARNNLAKFRQNKSAVKSIRYSTRKVRYLIDDLKHQFEYFAPNYHTIIQICSSRYLLPKSNKKGGYLRFFNLNVLEEELLNFNWNK